MSKPSNWKPKRTKPPASYSPGWLTELDSRKRTNQDLQARYSEILSDLGGADAVSYAKRSLAERAVLLEFHIAATERAMIEGRDYDVGRWVQACNALSGLYKTIGLERRSRDAPDLQQYLAQREGEAQE